MKIIRISRLVVLSSVLCCSLILGGVSRAQNSNQVMGQVDFEGQTKIDKDSGVWVDGQYLGYVKELKGNKKVLLIPGTHQVSVRQAGYTDYNVEIVVEPGGTKIVNVRMVKDSNALVPSVTGELKLKVKPDRAAVFVDGKFAGYVHEFGGVKRAMLIAPGKHHVKVALPGFKDFETEIVVQANRKVTVKTELAPASVTSEAPDLKKSQP
jgi:hypothetical protein